MAQERQNGSVSRTGSKATDSHQETPGMDIGEIDVASALVANVAVPADEPRPKRWALEHVAEKWGLDRTDLLRVNRTDAGAHGGEIAKIVMQPEDLLEPSDGTAPTAE